MLNEIFGPSIHLLILDTFLNGNEEILNLRSIARKVNKNPGTISRVMPMLVENGFIEQIKVGKTMNVYRLNQSNKIIPLIKEFDEKLRTFKKQNTSQKREESS